MPRFYDQLNRPVNLDDIPRRIISVVPSQTELLFHLGLDDAVTGITKFCIHPQDKVKNITKIGGTKQLNIELIKSLQPDLIIANKEENEQAQIEELARHFPVWISDIDDLQSATGMIERVGAVTGHEQQGIQLSSKIESAFSSINTSPTGLKVLYLIWRKPYMAAGTGTFINSMLPYCRLENAVETKRYPELTMADIEVLQPDVVFLSSEPYPFTQKHIAELQEVLPGANIMLVDGELFSWYGSRLLHSAGYFEQINKILIPTERGT